MIAADGNGNLPRLLPKRLLPAIVKVIDDRQELAKAIVTINNLDEGQHERELSTTAVDLEDAQSKKQANRVGVVKCYNCNKMGHYSSDCDKSCGYCHDKEHRGHECPKRLAKASDKDNKLKRKKSQTKRKNEMHR